MAKLSESKLSWPYLVLFLEDASQKVIQNCLRLYGSLTKLRPTKKHAYIIIISLQQWNLCYKKKKIQNTFVISIG